MTTTVTGPTNVDNVCYPVLRPSFTAQPPVDIAGCGAWPCTEVTVQTGGSENSLADVAQYYYKTDLRPVMTNDAPRAASGRRQRARGRQGVAPAHDDVQHRARRVGHAELPPRLSRPSTVTGDFAEIRTGAKNWPLWPDPLLDYSNPDNYDNPKSIDDFWHTAVDGRGRYFSATIRRRSSRASARPSQRSTTGWPRERRTERRRLQPVRATTSPIRRAISRARGKATSRRG